MKQAVWTLALVMVGAAAHAQDADGTAGDAEASEPAASADEAAEAQYDFATLAPRLAGDWEGTLAYRDYQSNRREEIPVRVMWTAAGDGGYLTADLVYTDPGQEVFAHSVTQPVGGQGVRVTLFRDGDVEIALRRVTAFTATDTGWTATYEERGQDDGEPALMRYVETMAEDAYTMRKDVQPEGSDDFVFRNEVTLERVAP